MLIRIADRISDITGHIAAWAFFGIGLIVTYEVVMRYVFVAPTIWVDEVSRIAQIWAAYLAMGVALKHREMIVIDVAFRDPESQSRKMAETLSLLIIIAVCAVAVWFGFGQWFEKTLSGDRTDTLLGVPKWVTLASIWVGFGILLLQACAEVARVWRYGVPVNEEPMH